MRRMYFDIDGSLLVDNTGEAKAALANGEFERAVRRSGVQQLICVGSFVDAGRTAKAANPVYDIHGAIFDICNGVFTDEEWFRASTALTSDSYYRAAEVDLDTDWFYLDDLAEHYFKMADREEVFAKHLGTRILVPTANGDGADVLDWIDHI